MPYEVQHKILNKMLTDWLSDTNPDRFKELHERAAEFLDHENTLIFIKTFFSDSDHTAAINYTLNKAPTDWQLIAVNILPNEAEKFGGLGCRNYEFVWQRPD